MEAERCTFFGPLPLVYIPTVADRRRLSPKVAIRDRKIRAMPKNFANASGLLALNVRVKI